MSNAVIGALRVNLSIDTGAFRDGLISAQKELQSAGAKMRGLGKDMAGIGGDLSLKVTAPLTLAGALILSTAGDFEAAMNRVGAATGASAGQMAALSDAARDLGKDTVFSAGEAAGAIEMLAKNGLDVSQILGGALKASLDLAAASGVELAEAADLTTDVMANFKKGAGDLAPVVNGVSGVLIASKFGFNDYRLALAQAGGVAGGFGVTLEDFNATIAATSARFASGSDAGTSFKVFLQRLVPQSKDAAKAVRALGLEFFTASGDLKSMGEIAQELTDGFAGLSDKAKSQALTDIFGTDAMRTAIGLMEQGADGIARLDAEIRKASAAEQAAARMKGWVGELEKLGGALDELKLAIADAGLLDMATRAVTAFADLVGQASALSPRLLQFGVVAGIAAAAVGPLLMVLGGVATGLAALATPIGLAVTAAGALAAAGTALYLNWDLVRAGFPEVAAAVETGLDLISMQLQAIGVLGLGGFEAALLGARSLGALLTGDLAGAADLAGASIARVGSTLADFSEVFVPGAKAALTEFATTVRTGIEDVIDWMVETFLSIPERFDAFKDTMAQIGRDLIDGLWQGMKSKWADLKSWVAGLAPELPQWFRDYWGVHSPSTVMAEIGTDLMAGLSQGIDGQTEGIRTGVGAFADDIAGLMRGVLFEGQSLREGLSSLFGGWSESLLSSGLSGLGSLIGLPGFAAGTRSAPGGLARINELGGEIVNLPRGAQVIPHDLSRRMTDLASRQPAGGRGPSAIAITVNGARGNSEIQSMVMAGVRAGLDQYDRGLADRVSQIGADPWYRG